MNPAKVIITVNRLQQFKQSQVISNAWQSQFLSNEEQEAKKKKNL